MGPTKLFLPILQKIITNIKCISSWSLNLNKRSFYRVIYCTFIINFLLLLLLLLLLVVLLLLLLLSLLFLNLEIGLLSFPSCTCNTLATMTYFLLKRTTILVQMMIISIY